MRLRYWLLFGTVSASALALGTLGVGCGGSSDDSTATGEDAGQDVTQQDHAAPQDVVSEPAPATCPDADLLTYSPPDAAINDAGVTVGECIACIRGPSGCQALAQACNNDCDCKTGVIEFGDCVGQGKPLFSCAAPLLKNSAGQALGACVFQKCAEQCGLPVDAGGADADAD